MALHVYHDANKAFPAPFLGDGGYQNVALTPERNQQRLHPSGPPRGALATLCPYMEQKTIWEM